MKNQKLTSVFVISKLVTDAAATHPLAKKAFEAYELGATAITNITNFKQLQKT